MTPTAQMKLHAAKRPAWHRRRLVERYERPSYEAYGGVYALIRFLPPRRVRALNRDRAHPERLVAHKLRCLGLTP